MIYYIVLLKGSRLVDIWRYDTIEEQEEYTKEFKNHLDGGHALSYDGVQTLTRTI